jgi:hypothetical protein
MAEKSAFSFFRKEGTFLQLSLSDRVNEGTILSMQEGVMKFKTSMLVVIPLFMCLSAVSVVAARQVEAPAPNNPTEPRPCNNPIDVPGKPLADQAPPVIPNDQFVDPPDGPPGPNGTLIGPCGQSQGHNTDYPCR